MDGGLIQNISLTEDLADIEITEIDLDTEGFEGSDEVKQTPSGDDAFILKREADTIGDGDIEFWEKILKIRDTV